MAEPSSKPVRPLHIALICVAVIAILFVGSIAIGVAVIQAERANPTSPTAEVQ